MTSSNISKLAAGYPVNGMTAVSVDSEEQQKEAQVMFAAIMSQAGTMFSARQDVTESGMPASAVKQSSGMDAVKDAVSDARSNYANGADSGRIKKADDNTQALREEAAEGAKELGEEVKSVIEEEFSVTEEELTSVLEQLGLSVMDLLNPTNLAQVVAVLTGTSDTSSLLMSNEFVNVMQQCMELTAELAKELGITPEQLQQMLVEPGVQPEMTTRDETMVMEEQDFAEVLTETAQTDANEKAVTPEAEGEQSVRKAETVNAEESVVSEEPEIREEERAAVQSGEAMEDAPENGTADQRQESSQTAKQEVRTSENRMFEHAATQVQGQNETVAFTPQPQAMSYSQPVNVAEVINQIAEFVKVSASADVSTLEMQLNPENLGKLYLHISATKEGNVTAQFAAQNEAVKEALETQLVELRQTLNQQGVKVDAIEVTVASHEFEKNLEQNAEREKRQGEQQEKQQGRRSLNLNNLDELSGLMTEEEMLAAKIMQDNGNSMDVIA